MIGGGKIKKTGHVIQTAPVRGCFVIPRLAFDIFYLQTKFGDCRFSRYGYIIAGIKIEYGSCSPDHAPLRVICHQYAGT